PTLKTRGSRSDLRRGPDFSSSLDEGFHPFVLRLSKDKLTHRERAALRAKASTPQMAGRFPNHSQQKKGPEQSGPLKLHSFLPRSDNPFDEDFHDPAADLILALRRFGQVDHHQLRLPALVDVHCFLPDFRLA